MGVQGGIRRRTLQVPRQRWMFVDVDARAVRDWVIISWAAASIPSRLIPPCGQETGV